MPGDWPIFSYLKINRTLTPKEMAPPALRELSLREPARRLR
jgi:hypothetical protein